MRGHALAGYAAVFFGLWWAWVNFTWFASAYDTDDVPYRLPTLLQMAGVLVFAAGIPAAFEHFDFATVVAGYVIMRMALVAQWLRAARGHPEGRASTLRYAAGVTVVQACWIGRLWLPGLAEPASFVVLVVAELLVPAWAEFGGRPTPWHPGHITERYGEFTIIVLGEVVAAIATAVQEAVDNSRTSPGLITAAAAGLLLVFTLWWLYFKSDTGGRRSHPRPHPPAQHRDHRRASSPTTRLPPHRRPPGNPSAGTLTGLVAAFLVRAFAAEPGRSGLHAVRFGRHVGSVVEGVEGSGGVGLRRSEQTVPVAGGLPRA
jgi:low temperature requirement protein LtrA